MRLRRRRRAYRRHRDTTYSTTDNTTLTSTDVASGKYTVVFFPRYTMSPGNFPSGSPLFATSITTTPASTNNPPTTTSNFPRSVTPPV